MRRCTKWYASKESMYQMKETRVLNEEMVSKKLIVGVLLHINEVEFSIYKFLTSVIKNVKKQHQPVDQLLGIKCMTDDLWASIGKDFTLDRECIATGKERRFLHPMTAYRPRRLNRLSGLANPLGWFINFVPKTYVSAFL